MPLIKNAPTEKPVELARKKNAVVKDEPKLRNTQGVRKEPSESGKMPTAKPRKLAANKNNDVLPRKHDAKPNKSEKNKKLLPLLAAKLKKFAANKNNDVLPRKHDARPNKNNKSKKLLPLLVAKPKKPVANKNRNAPPSKHDARPNKNDKSKKLLPLLAAKLRNNKTKIAEYYPR